MTSTESRPLGLRRELGLPDLVLFNVVAVLGVQSIPVFAHVGLVAIPLHLAASGLFFVPCALVVAFFSRRFPGEGGFYVWTKAAFGERHAFLCGWCWWLSVLLYLPGLVLMASGMAALVTGASLSEAAQVSLSLFLLWLTVAANILGLRVGKWLSNASGILIYLGGVLVLAASLVVWSRHGAAGTLALDTTVDLSRVSLWAQIAFAYTGLELGSLLGGEVRNPARTIPRAAWLSAAGVTGAYVLGSFALMLVLAPENIDPMTGLVQVAATAGARLGVEWLGTLAAVLLCAGMVGRIGTWSGGAARMPLVIGIDGAFPAVFTRIHPRWGTPWAALLVQGVACSLFLVLTQAGETIRSGWQLLMDMEILVTFVPYLYIFLSAWKFRLHWSGAEGVMVTLLAMGFALVPPETTDSMWIFETKVIGGSLLLVLGGWVVFRMRRTTGAISSLDKV